MEFNAYVQAHVVTEVSTPKGGTQRMDWTISQIESMEFNEWRNEKALAAALRELADKIEKGAFMMAGSPNA